jgi:hypothetical protein
MRLIVSFPGCLPGDAYSEMMASPLAGNPDQSIQPNEQATD